MHALIFGNLLVTVMGVFCFILDMAYICLLQRAKRSNGIIEH